jgi:hypothetical protein
MLGVPYSPMVPSFTRWQSGAEFAQREQQIEGPHHVVYLCKHRVLAVDHGVRRGALLGKMHHGVRREPFHHLGDEIVVGDIAGQEFDIFAGDPFQARSRSGMVRIGVSVCTPSS